MSGKVDNDDLMVCTTEIASSYFSKNNVSIDEISDVIENIYNSLIKLSGEDGASLNRPEPIVPIKKSIHPDYIICLEDGKKLKMLKRHLKTAYNMTPKEYRERWGLPSDYPMVAPNYARHRSALAKDIGLGKK